MTPDKLFGQTLNGRYRILELLGVGGMGAVYRAHDGALSREVAIKVMTPQMSSAPEAISRFKRERKTVAGLEHPHIVPIYDSGDFEGMTYVAMRLLPGGSLADRLRRARVTGEIPSLGECATL